MLRLRAFFAPSLVASLVMLGFFAPPPVRADFPTRKGDLGKIRALGGDSALLTQANPGTTVTLHANVFNSLPVTLQWSFNGIPIPGATGPDLALSNLTAAQAGNYGVRFTTPWGTTSQSFFVVNVAASPPSPVDRTFVAQLPADDAVYLPETVLSDGRIVLTCRRAIGSTTYVRLRADGSADSTWTVPPSAGWILCVLPDGGIVTQKTPFRFDPDGTARSLALPAGFATDQPLDAAAPLAGRGLLIAQQSRLVLLDPSDQVDPGFTSTYLAGTQITAVCPDGFDRVFAIDKGQYQSSYTAMLRRLRADGSPDADFAPLPIRYSRHLLVASLDDGSTVVDSGGEGNHVPLHILVGGEIDPNWPKADPLSPAACTLNTTVCAVDPRGRIYAFVYDFSDGGRVWRLLPGRQFRRDPTFYGGADDFPRWWGERSLDETKQVLLQPDGRLLVAGRFNAWDRHASPRLVRLNTSDVRAPYTPEAKIGIDPDPNGGATWFPEVFGPGPFHYEWLPLGGNTLPPVSPDGTLFFDKMRATNFGPVQLRVTGPGGTALSPIIDPTPVTSPLLRNLSGRAAVGTGEEVMIGGFIRMRRTDWSWYGVNPPESYYLIRAAGPALALYGVSPALPNPVLDLYDGSGRLKLNNDNWPATLASEFALAGAFGFLPGSNDAAMSLVAGRDDTSAFTAVVSDRQGNPGVALLEIYDRGGYPLLNLSMRARAGRDAATLIGGIIIGDPDGDRLEFHTPLRGLIRAVGPTLGQFGISHPLADPKLTLFNAVGEIITANDNWGESADPAMVAAAMRVVGAFDLPTGSKDAALLLDLPAGAYTAHVTGSDGGTGVALLEIYRVP